MIRQVGFLALYYQCDVKPAVYGGAGQPCGYVERAALRVKGMADAKAVIG